MGRCWRLQEQRSHHQLGAQPVRSAGREDDLFGVLMRHPPARRLAARCLVEDREPFVVDRTAASVGRDQVRAELAVKHVAHLGRR